MTRDTIRRRFGTLLAVGLGLVAARPVVGADWAQWRGPAFDGSSPETGLADSWSQTENVAWAVDLPGPSAATPVIQGDHVYVSSTDAAADALLGMALDRRTGRELWRRTVAAGTSRDRLSNYASPSPVTDGDVVVFFYGNGRTAAFDQDGQELWSRDLAREFGEFAFQWTFAASPLLHGGKLYYQVLQRNVPVRGRGGDGGPIDSYLLAVHPATGKTLWRHVRPSDAVAESREAYTTPIPFTIPGGRSEVLVAGGDCLTGHDPETGREFWRWGTWNPGKIGHWRLVPSPVAGAGVILACAPKREPIFAVKADGQGALTDAALAWTTEEVPDLTSDVPTPLFYQGDFFVLSDLRKTLARVDPATGKAKWIVPTPGRAKYEASPTGADGRVFLMNFAGEVAVFAAADGALLHTIPMGKPGDDQTRSTVAVAHGQLFIRTNSQLYCIRKPE
ncbi:MAG: PQQ-binding-like beta-propeller repeat protein [Verrucomicrobiales bacterium]|nr:PQQ-binding-like beta-propeller repeat protein [Verrucomicrobiales bacterium]MCP5525250.1 PQQ-binding-like beta-propeller repeat protein [Verrucomicrobiales bacterium]